MTCVACSVWGNRREKVVILLCTGRSSGQWRRGTEYGKWGGAEEGQHYLSYSVRIREGKRWFRLGVNREEHRDELHWKSGGPSGTGHEEKSFGMVPLSRWDEKRGRNLWMRTARDL